MRSGGVIGWGGVWAFQLGGHQIKQKSNQFVERLQKNGGLKNIRNVNFVEGLHTNDVFYRFTQNVFILFNCGIRIGGGIMPPPNRAVRPSTMRVK
jgi:hypothetical protein